MDTKTKEEIFEKNLEGVYVGISASRLCLKAIDEYSKQECIEFAKYINSGGLNQQWFRAEDDKWELLKPCKTPDDRIFKTTEELYNLYLKEK